MVSVYLGDGDDVTGEGLAGKAPLLSPTERPDARLSARPAQAPRPSIALRSRRSFDKGVVRASTCRRCANVKLVPRWKDHDQPAE
ncbi:MAG: hypothetical protein CMJ59_25235 [Planctomycetaceae bacterium]|nr:hypothetical protein [Planctomycetaceae bacterium]